LTWINFQADMNNTYIRPIFYSDGFHFLIANVTSNKPAARGVSLHLDGVRILGFGACPVILQVMLSSIPKKRAAHPAAAARKKIFPLAET